MRKTKIVCTIGPSSESEEMLEKLALTGMDVIRLNFSHGDFEEHGNRIKNIRKVSEKLGKNIAILLDTKGPEVRLGEFANGAEEYKIGDVVTLVREKIVGTKEAVHVQCPEVFDDLQVGSTVLVDDGKMRLTVIDKKDGLLQCRIENAGFLKSKKGCNLPNVKLSMPFVSAKDEADIRFGCRQGVDYIAASFTRRKEDVIAIRNILKEEGNTHIQIIAKIENQEGFDNLDEILEHADGIMVARGDLGVDVSFELVPIYQKAMIKRANELGKPVITATHMLDSMTFNPRPTRAEASDVANAVFDGTDAIMLSGESAAGDYPIEAVQTMVTISTGIEKILNYKEKLRNSIETSTRTKQDAIAIATSEISTELDIAGIVAFTSSGNTARRISKFRPNAPIFAVTFDAEIQRSLALNFGVNTVLETTRNTQENEIELACKIAKENGILPGQHIIITAGYPVGSGATNAMKIIEVK